MKKLPRRRVCFVTGTRAEYGLMQPVLRAIADHPRLQLQIVVTGMHLDRRRGRSVEQIGSDGWHIDAVVPWRAGVTPVERAVATGRATAALAQTFDELRTDVVLVVGDRVEALAATTAGHLCDRAVAHIHGGDRALGQADDSLRHAITKLSHVHFPATRASAERIRRLGEDPKRIYRVGSPGLDGIRTAAASEHIVQDLFPSLTKYRFALCCLHPTEPDPAAERRRSALLIDAMLCSGFDHVVAVMPNNDPGSEGIAAQLKSMRDGRVTVLDNVPRGTFLGLLRRAAMLVGNSSSGIIEAASFGLPVIDIGPRQDGREHGSNVVRVAFTRAAILRAVNAVWKDGRPVRFGSENLYAAPRGTSAASGITRVLSHLRIDATLLRKLIAY